jgi:hypothetical protein
MSINLTKRAEKVGIVLAKRGLTKVPPVRVGVALDVSGSAEPFYSHGVMQETIDRLLGVALKFDDNGELDAWMFHNRVYGLPTITESDEGSYVRNKILTRRGDLWGGTSYAPPLRAAMDYYFGTTSTAQAPAKKSGFLGGLFGKKEEAAPVVTTNSSKDPAMLLFITDGSSDDEANSAALLREAAKSSPMYFNFVGIGNASYFKFIEQMGDELPNVGFVNLASLSMSDEQLYEALVSQEFVDWIKKLQA